MDGWKVVEGEYRLAAKRRDRGKRERPKGIKGSG